MDNTPESSYGLSPMQQGMLFHSLYAPESGVNIQQIVGTLRHPVNVEKFEQAWKQLCARHVVLRTAFRWSGAESPMQDVYAEVQLPFEIQDWRSIAPGENAHRLETFLKRDRHRGLALERAPLMRVALFQKADHEFQFVWTFHHAILDGNSFGPLLKEVFVIYEGLMSGTEASLPKARPFREYIEWQEKQDFSKDESFWREELKGFRAPTPLMVDSPAGKGAAQAVEYGEDSLRLSAECTRDLRTLAEKHGLGISTIVQGAWGLLLARYSGEEDVVFGVIRAGRRSSISGAEAITGIFINTLPLRCKIAPEIPVLDWLKQSRERQKSMRLHEHTPLLEIQKWSEVAAGGSLFESILVFDHQTLNTALRAQGGDWERREFRVIDQTNFPLTVYGFAEPELLLKMEFDRRRFESPAIARMLGHLATLLEAIAKNPSQRISDLPLLTANERNQLLVEWNQTQAEYPRERCVHQLFEEQVILTPDATALVFEDEGWTYRELNDRAERVAAHLRGMGVGPDVLVGICVERSLEMIAGLLGIMKAGGAYVPLDPAYPRERLSHMIEDSRMPVLLTQERLRAGLPPNNAAVACLDNLGPVPTSHEPTHVRASKSNDLIYVIYTSGSTGKPKGVMLTHRNVVNFFTGMDQILGREKPDTWLAVTSISFDISVLEIFWTLTRGFKVVIQGEENKASDAETAAEPGRKVDFSLFYFSGDEGQNPQDKYRLLMEGAKFADDHGFAAVWTPERHFHAFGGLYPNPSLTSAAIAAITKRVKIRAGSVVLPLHNPIRVAEEWSVVDNLSRGRVGLSFASGWHSNDFVFAPENYANRKKVMLQQIETVMKLWRGEAIACSGPEGKEVKVKILPRPVQRDVPVWITASASPDTFRLAGEMGANILTNLLGQTIEEVAAKIAIYRQAWREHGHGPGEGHVSLMLHTFVERDMKTVRDKVRGPFTEYLKTSVDLVSKAASAWSFAAFQQPGALRSKGEAARIDFSTLSPADVEALLDHAFERYFETSGLFGTPQSCLKRVNELRRIGVNEIACLIDFGIDVDSVLEGLRHLEELNLKANPAVAPKRANYSIPAQIRRHAVTHFQCTPSLARMLMSDPEGMASLGRLKEFLVGGEALPSALAAQLCELGPRIHNMYGPTETAIWSSTKLLSKNKQVMIGRPLANTEIFICDKSGHPAPIGLPGELLIGGDGLARGYLNRSELTAERFIRHPFSTDSEARVYRTGDLARYRSDGEIEFLGRTDQQVKLRGHRIELGEIESALGAHPAVKESVVVADEDAAGNARLVAYVVPGGNSHAKNGNGASGQGNDRLSQWQMIWDGAYNEGNPTPDPVFNIAGWNSSYTGQPMPEAEMREWVDRTVERILALKPANVLELGCGTGLLLFRIAPHCKQYIGCDFSERALNYLGQQLQRQPLPQVALMQMAADHLEKIPQGSVDTVILNSVAQYFPDVNYLVRVLEGAVKAVSPGGRIFIGDVRNFDLLEAFHASIEMHQAPKETTREQFRHRVRSKISREEELLIAPEFFHALQQYLPRISQVEIQIKSGSFHNEVNRFRYDLTLHVEGAMHTNPDVLWLEGSPRNWTAEDVKQALASSGFGYVGFKELSNARLVGEEVALKWITGSDGPETLGELRAGIETGRRSNATDPEEILKLAKGAGCFVDMSWSEQAGGGAFDVVFRRLESPAFAPRANLMRRKPWNEYANQPAQGRADTKLIVQLRNHLKQKLPGIMVPSAFVILESMPLTPNGKVNRRALPAPNVTRDESVETFVAPRTAVEQALAGIWREILGIESVGVEDDFFKLGGHSLLATQMVSRLRAVFKIDLPLRALFEAPTIAKLVRQLVERETSAGLVEKTAEILNQLEEMSAGELEEAIGQREAAVPPSTQVSEPVAA